MTTRPAFAHRMSLMKASEVREILKVTERPDVLSFAGGLPAPESFPVEALAHAHAEVFAQEGAQALQYSTTEGHKPLRAWIAERAKGAGRAASIEHVLVTSGSQQGIDLACKVLLDPGDAVVVENPSYLAALQVFGGYEASVVAVGSDDDGMRVDELPRVFREQRPKMIYLTPTFQNPKGTTLSLERRQTLVKLAAEHGVAVLEDEPYAELRYRGNRLPSLLELDGGKGTVLSLSTFSKTLAPGLRIGWVIGPEPIVRALTIAKQAADLHTGTLTQRAVARLLETFDYEGHLGKIRSLYGERCAAMQASLRALFPAGCVWTNPDGGLFLWCKLPAGVKAAALFEDAIAQKVALVPGKAFFAAPPDGEYVRLNFSNRPPEAIADGMGRLARAVHARLAVPARGAVASSPSA